MKIPLIAVALGMSILAGTVQASTSYAQSSAATSLSWPSPEAIATAYTRSMYRGDAEAQETFFPLGIPDLEREETTVELEDLSVRVTTAEDAQDFNPLTQWVYVRVQTDVSVGDRLGTGDYLIGLHPSSLADGNLLINKVSGSISWAQPIR
jgi:hypothetical protein